MGNPGRQVVQLGKGDALLVGRHDRDGVRRQLCVGLDVAVDRSGGEGREVPALGDDGGGEGCWGGGKVLGRALPLPEAQAEPAEEGRLGRGLFGQGPRRVPALAGNVPKALPLFHPRVRVAAEAPSPARGGPGKAPAPRAGVPGHPGLGGAPSVTIVPRGVRAPVGEPRGEHRPACRPRGGHFDAVYPSVQLGRQRHWGPGRRVLLSASLRPFLLLLRHPRRRRGNERVYHGTKRMGMVVVVVVPIRETEGDEWLNLILSQFSSLSAFLF